MTIDELPDIVYHGTITTHKNSLLNGIDLKAGKNKTDFGKGFYTTTNLAEAQSLALKRAEMYESQAMIVTYSLNKDIVKSLNWLCLDTPTDKWHEFIYNNRLRTTISQFHNRSCYFDVVYGCVADGNIGYLTKFQNGDIISMDEFKLKNKPFKDYDQLSFHTKEAISALSIADINVIELKEGELVC